jgi:hypothetical protein
VVTIWTLARQSLRITWFWDLTTILQVCMEDALDALSVPSDVHTPLSEIVD